MRELRMDNYDEKILHLLKTDGRIRLNKIAELVGLSPPACHSRIIKLEDFNFIKGYSAIIDYKKLGFDLSCLIYVSFEVHANKSQIVTINELINIKEITEILHITGEHDLLLKVMVKNTAELNILINKKICTIPGVSKVQTSMILDVCKPIFSNKMKPSIISML